MLEIGSVVYLIGDDSVPMTVKEINGRDITCVWFDKKNILHRGLFDLACLEEKSDGG